MKTNIVETIENVEPEKQLVFTFRMQGFTSVACMAYGFEASHIENTSIEPFEVKGSLSSYDHLKDLQLDGLKLGNSGFIFIRESLEVARSPEFLATNPLVQEGWNDRLDKALEFVLDLKDEWGTNNRGWKLFSGFEVYIV